MSETEQRPVLVVDFGAQYAQLIARRVREANVYSEIANPLSIEALLFVLYFIGVALCFACSAWYFVQIMHCICLIGKLTHTCVAAMWHGTSRRQSHPSAIDLTSVVSYC